MTEAIQCKYSCFQCGIKEQIVTVPARGSEDVLVWLEQVAAPGLSADHQRRSPHCRITKLDEIMIPLFEDSAGVGGAGVIPMKEGKE
jgi:hypothetical protein